MPEEAAQGPPIEANGTGHVSFSDVARAHFDWDQQNDEAAREKFESKLNAFETDAGQVIEAYWCRKAASAVALTRRNRERPRGLRRVLDGCPDSEYGLYRVTDWATSGTKRIPDLLHDCDILAIKASNSLRGTAQAVVMQWLLAVESHILGFIERDGDSSATDAQVNAFANRQPRNFVESRSTTSGRARSAGACGTWKECSCSESSSCSWRLSLPLEHSVCSGFST